MKNPKGITSVVAIVIIAVVAIGAGAIFYVASQKQVATPDTNIVVTNVNKSFSSCTTGCQKYGFTTGSCLRLGSSAESIQFQQKNKDKILSSLAGSSPKVTGCDFSSVGAWDDCVCSVSTNVNIQVYSNGNGNTNTTSNVNSVVNGNTNTVVDPTAGWKTYTNTELGFQFKYPPSWGNVTVNKKVASTINENKTGSTVERGKAILFNFADNANKWTSGVWLQASSSDFQQFMNASYNGGEDLAKGCTNPGIVGDNSFCSIRTVANTTTADIFAFDSPECSPRYIREVRLNLVGSDYAGLQIATSFPSSVDCVSSDEKNNQTKKSELTSYFGRKNLDPTQLQKLQDFDTFLSTFTLTQ